MDLNSFELGVIKTQLSAMRNSIITITLGIAIYGVSQSLKHISKLFLEIVSVLIYYFSFFLLYNNNQMFNNFAKKLEDKSEETNTYINRHIMTSWLLLFLFGIFVIIGTYRSIVDFLEIAS